MIFADILLRELLRGWLEWTDIVRLQTNSSRIIRDVIAEFLQSTDFNAIYMDAFDDVFTCDSGKRDKPFSRFRLFTRLEWVKNKKVNLDNCLTHFEASHFASLEAQQNLQQYEFVKTAVIAYDEVVSFTQVVAVLLDAFPSLQGLTLVGNKVPSDLLRGLLIVSSALTLRSLRFEFDAVVQFAAEQTSLLCKVFRKLPLLEIFAVPVDWQIPQDICSTLLTYCKNLKYFPFNNRNLSPLAASLVMRASTLCPSLTELTITHCKVDINDEHMRTLCERLPGLERVNVRHSAMSLQSFVTVMQHCRHICVCAIQGLVWTKLDTNPSGCVSSLSLQGVPEDLLKHPAFSILLTLVPHPLSLSLEEHVDFLACTHLHAALAAGHGDKVQEMVVCIDAMENLEYIAKIFSLTFRLQCVMLKDQKHTLVPRALMEYIVSMLCTHCTLLHTIILDSVADFNDSNLVKCVEGLRDLHTIMLQGHMRSITGSSLTSLSRTNKAWQHVRLWGASISLTDIVQHMEQEGLTIKLLDFQINGCMCSVGYGKVPVRVTDVIHVTL